MRGAGEEERKSAVENKARQGIRSRGAAEALKEEGMEEVRGVEKERKSGDVNEK